jgi:hypothetical protein
MIPPYIPKQETVQPSTPVHSPIEAPPYESFDSMLHAFGRGQWTNEGLDPGSDKKVFGTWDYVAKEAQRVEFGLSNQMEQYDTNMKIRQMLGEKREEEFSKRLSLSIKAAAIGLLSSSGSVKFNLQHQLSNKSTKNRSLYIEYKNATNKGQQQLNHELSISHDEEDHVVMAVS